MGIWTICATVDVARHTLNCRLQLPRSPLLRRHLEAAHETTRPVLAATAACHRYTVRSLTPHTCATVSRDRPAASITEPAAATSARPGPPGPAPPR